MGASFPGCSLNVARMAAQSLASHFVLVSTDKAVEPTSVMGLTKRVAERIVQSIKADQSPATRFISVRFGNVLGSSGSVIPLFQEQIARGGPVTLTDPRVTRYFMTVQEAVGLVLQAGGFARGGEVFVLDMGEPVPIMRLARQVIESAGYTVRDAEHPEGDIDIEIIGLRPGEKIEEELTLSGDRIGTRYLGETIADNAKAEARESSKPEPKNTFSLGINELEAMSSSKKQQAQVEPATKSKKPSPSSDQKPAASDDYTRILQQPLKRADAFVTAFSK